MKRWTLALGQLFVACQLTAATQLNSPLAFDAAAIRENRDPGTGGTLRVTPGGSVQARHMSARALVVFAHELEPYQLVGEPAWTRSTYYDVAARPSGAATREQARAMLRTLLVERFKLRTRLERRELDGFALVRERPDRLGPGLRPSTLDCDVVGATEARCRAGGVTDGSIAAVGVSIAILSGVLQRELSAPIANESGVTGTFDVDLRWSNDLTPTGDLPPLVTAIREQLGLRLQSRRVTSDVVVLEEIKRPPPD
ncbi:MAG TPA: TIGR03435 family protein [Vicinamibacterales bacterium]|jgi:uncharacterized protein (TIGR03435 family)|nr:TIGR03435 family protein [Vicinamibacterales bacterium]